MPETTISHVNTEVNNNAEGAGGLTNSLTVNVPSGTTNGMVMIACVYMAETDTLTAPGGWTQFGSTFSNATQNLETSIWYRVASSEPASYTWTIGTTNIWGVSQSTFSGVDTTTPVHATNNQNITATTNPLTPPSVTTTIYTNILTFQATRSTDTVEKTATSSDTELADWGKDGGTTCRNGHLYFKTAKQANGTPAGAAITISSTTNVSARHQWSIALTPDDPTDPDTGTGTEGNASITGTVTGANVADSGTGSEGQSVSVPLSGGNDTGTGTEGSSPTVTAVTEYLIHDDFDRPDETELTISSSGHDWTSA